MFHPELRFEPEPVEVPIPRLDNDSPIDLPPFRLDGRTE